MKAMRVGRSKLPVSHNILGSQCRSPLLQTSLVHCAACHTPALLFASVLAGS